MFCKDNIIYAIKAILQNNLMLRCQWTLTKSIQFGENETGYGNFQFPDTVNC